MSKTLDRIANKEVVTASVSDLKIHPDNPRIGDLELIKQSITDYGFFGTVVANKKTGFVVVGNHRVKAARELEIEKVPVAWIDVDPDIEQRILLIDNRSSDLGGYNSQKLESLLNSIGPLVGTGYTDADLAELIAETEQLDEDDPFEHWKGMPHYESENQGEHRAIIVRFDDEEAVQDFQKKLGLNLTEATRSIWYPPRENNNYMDVAYVKEEA